MTDAQLVVLMAWLGALYGNADLSAPTVAPDYHDRAAQFLAAAQARAAVVTVEEGRIVGPELYPTSDKGGA